MKKILLEQKGDYSLFARLNKDNSIREYVVAWAYDTKSDSWGQGFYIPNLSCALEFFKKKISMYNTPKEKLVEAMENLKSAWIDCDDAFFDNELDCNIYVSDEYPFDKPFEELYTLNWINKSLENLKR